MTTSASLAADAATAALPPHSVALVGQVSNAPLAHVSLAYLEHRFKLHLRFGEPVRTLPLDRWRCCAVPPPGTTLCRTRWQANDYGTARWQLMVVQTATPFDAVQHISGVQPDARLLLHTEGDTNVRAMLERIDDTEVLGIALIDASPAHWCTLGNRLAACLVLPEYTAEWHTTLLAGKVLP